MMQGRMEGLQAILPVTFLLPGQPGISMEFVVDTGFEGALTLPPAAVAALGLPFFQEIEAKLADDTPARVDGHIATIRWGESQVEVLVLAMGKRPLLGTALLKGRELVARFVPDGPVTIADI